jgi:hypothetical protein
MLVVVAFAAAGCGGGSTASTPSLANASFLASADALCAQLNHALPTTERPGLSMHEIASLSSAHARLEQTSLQKLGKLTPPASLTDAWASIVRYRQTLVEELIKFERDAEANDASAVQALTVSKERVHRRLLATARNAGFTDCARVG